LGFYQAKTAVAMTKDPEMPGIPTGLLKSWFGQIQGVTLWRAGIAQSPRISCREEMFHFSEGWLDGLPDVHDDLSGKSLCGAQLVLAGIFPQYVWLWA